MVVKFGAFVPQGWKMELAGIADPVDQYEELTKVARTAEELGFDSIWVYDHFHTVPAPADESTFEAWTITAGLVRDTQRVRVGQMATCNGYRNPALLAKMASTVDAMSHGRLICGLGAGWRENEWQAYGYGFPDLPVRMGMLREACEIISKMWTEDRPSFEGKYYTINAPINQPKGAHNSPPTLWIAGEGEQVTLKLVARFATGCNVGGGNPDDIRRKIDILRRHCETVGRDPSEITVSTNIENVHLLAPGEDPDKVADWSNGRFTLDQYHQRFKVLTSEELAGLIEQAVDAGADYVILNMAGRASNQEEMIYHFAREIMPQFA